MARMVDLSSAGPLTVEEIGRWLELEKTQVNAWLKRAVSEGKIEKLTKPVKYRMAFAGRRQASLFGDAP
jgi:predicted transcriptional regulator